MNDFLKGHPQVTKDEYLWEWTVPQVDLAGLDETHIEYLTEKQAEIDKARQADVGVSNKDLVNDLGIPIL